MGVAHDKKIRVHCVQRQRGIDQRFAFFDRAGLHRHVHNVRAQPLARDLKAGLRSGGGFKEHVDLGFARQRIRVLAVGPVQIDIVLGTIKNGGNGGWIEALDPKKMSLAECHLANALLIFTVYRKVMRRAQGLPCRGVGLACRP